MTAPTGLLSWGQSQTFNAKDDRLVITALANEKAGIVHPATFAAGSGLSMTIGAFSLICGCGDGTLCVVGSTTSQVITLLAGPTSGSRIDIVWVDIDVSAGTWTINLRTAAEVVGRLGFKLGQVTMPQNSNLASQATLAPSPAGWVPFPQPTTPVSVSLVRSSPISCGTATNVNIGAAGLGWQSEELGAAATLWNSTGFIAPSAGIYLVSGQCLWAPSSLGFKAASLLKNGVLSIYSETRVPMSTGSAYSSSLVLAHPIKCIAGDVISLQVYHASTVTISMTFAHLTVCQQS